jgi:hypothetical protein
MRWPRAFLWIGSLVFWLGLWGFGEDEEGEGEVSWGEREDVRTIEA